MNAALGRLALGISALASALALTACGGSSVPAAPDAANAAKARPLRTGSLTAWRSALGRVPLPGDGCYRATYPALTWSTARCGVPSTRAMASFAQRRAHETVGNGNDYTIRTRPHLIVSAIGTFPVVDGVTSEKTANALPSESGVPGINSYTLQLNAGVFSTTACNGEARCSGWEQFVFANPPGTGGAQAYIQYWLLRSGASGKLPCPGGHWWKAGSDCYYNSPRAVDIPNQSFLNFASIAFTGTARASGDTIAYSDGTTTYAMTVRKGSIADLHAHWYSAEFNVFGNAGGSQAQFNTGSTIDVSVEADDGAPGAAPACPPGTGTTGEGNNLVLVPATNGNAMTYPSIHFTESNAPKSGPASCAALPAGT